MSCYFRLQGHHQFKKSSNFIKLQTALIFLGFVTPSFSHAAIAEPPRSHWGSVASAGDCASLLRTLNEELQRVYAGHIERQWELDTGLAQGSLVEEGIQAAQKAYEAWVQDPSHLELLDSALWNTDLGTDLRVINGLRAWQVYFRANQTEDAPTHRQHLSLLDQEVATALEIKAIVSGYQDPEKGFIRVPPSGFFPLIGVNPQEPIRRAAFEGLRAYERELAERYRKLVPERQKLARLAGDSGFYAHKLKIYDGGMSEEWLFELFDRLEKETRPQSQQVNERLRREKGNDAFLPWNYPYSTTGVFSTALRPYFGMDTVLRGWATSIARSGIDFKGARITIDLFERKGKKNNPFMHVAAPSFYNLSSKNFQSGSFYVSLNANPTKPALAMAQGLYHESGHVASFANTTGIYTPMQSGFEARPPTSRSALEVSARLMEYYRGDAIHFKRYARNSKGEPMPDQLIENYLVEQQLAMASGIRLKMAMPYFERAVYQMRESDLTVENILAKAREVENMLLGRDSTIPLLIYDHHYNFASAASHHDYLIASMAAYQIWAALEARFGVIVDNPEVGPYLEENFWKLGNTKSLDEILIKLTGSPLQPNALIKMINRSEEDIRQDIRRKLALANQPSFRSTYPELNAVFVFTDGNDIIATTEYGDSFDSVIDQVMLWAERHKDRFQPKR